MLTGSTTCKKPAPGSPFHLVGPTLEPNRIVGGMSLGYVVRNWSAGFNYDASTNSGALAQSATLSERQFVHQGAMLLNG